MAQGKYGQSPPPPVWVYHYTESPLLYHEAEWFHFVVTWYSGDSRKSLLAAASPFSRSGVGVPSSLVPAEAALVMPYSAHEFGV